MSGMGVVKSSDPKPPSVVRIVSTAEDPKNVNPYYKLLGFPPVNGDQPLNQRHDPISNANPGRDMTKVNPGDDFYAPGVYYNVQSGDTAMGIARKFNVSPELVMVANRKKFPNVDDWKTLQPNTPIRVPTLDLAKASKVQGYVSDLGPLVDKPYP